MAAKPRQSEDAFITALAGGSTIADACRQAGTSERTGYRWAADATIAARVRQARSGIVGRAHGLLTLATVRAAETLTALLADESSGIKLAAARAILESRQRLHDSVELEERLAALEQRAAALGERGVNEKR